MLGLLIGVVGGSTVLLMATWPTTKPILQKKLAALIVKLAPKYLGGAKLTLNQVLVGCGCDFSVGVDQLQIKNLDGWRTDYLLSLAEVFTTVSVGKLSKSVAAGKGHPSEVIIQELRVRGCKLNYEKTLMSSNINALLDAMNSQEKEEQERMDVDMGKFLDAAKDSACDASKAVEDGASKGTSLPSLPALPAKPSLPAKKKPPVKIILHKVVIEGVEMAVSSAISSSTVTVPSIVIEDFYAKYGPASARSLLQLLITMIFQESAKAVGETIAGVGNLAVSAGSGAVSVAQGAVSSGSSFFGGMFGGN
mmetsp:Transcript_32612/g.74527  ORF Transcript_32612/g.74527 Transcript_32612/m.74527 type:complete len:307 (+) Transcript_32612:109-1029(+)